MGAGTKRRASGIGTAKRAARGISSQAASSRPSSPRGGALPLTVSRAALMVRGSDDAFRQLVHSLFAFAARHHAIREGHAHAIGLAGIEYTILIAVSRLGRDGPVNVKTVADHLSISGAFVTTVTRRLQAAGLVEKLPDSVDRRRVFLRMTRAGLDRLRRLAPQQREVNDLEFGCLSAAEFRVLGDIMQRLIPCADQALALQELRRLATPARGRRTARD